MQKPAYHSFLDCIHPSWDLPINQALAKVDPNYINHLLSNEAWLPGQEHLLRAFSLPITHVRFVLFGESPYPRKESAIGYAFWDNAVSEIWSKEGLSKKVNRATSLRNLIKMLLVAEGLLDTHHLDQASISKINKQRLIHSNEELFANFDLNGFLLLNACLVLQKTSKLIDAKAWRPFIKEILEHLLINCPDVQFIFFGKIAGTIKGLMQHPLPTALIAEHPYNHTFITNPSVLKFFSPLHLLCRQKPN